MEVDGLWRKSHSKELHKQFGHAVYFRVKLKHAVQDMQVLEPRMMTRVLITPLYNVRANRSSVDTSNHELVIFTCFTFLYFNFL
jgi:hypothetical protein